MWFDPIRLPEAVLAENVEGLRCRDAGVLFRLARQHAGASQLRLSAATGLSQGRVSKLLSGRGGAVTSLEVWERIAAGLNLPDQARLTLGLAPATGSGEQSRPGGTTDGVGTRTLDGTGDGLVLVELPERGVEMTVSRRVLLTALGLGSTAGVLGDVDRAAADVVVDDELLAEFTVGLRQSQAAGRMLPPVRVIDSLTGQVAVLDVLRRRAPQRLHVRCVRLQAQYSEYLSWMVQESGDPGGAVYWVDRAQQWAGLGDWPEMMAYTHVRRSMLASRCAKDGPAAVEHATRVVHSPNAPAWFKGLAEKEMAHGYALFGRREDCHRALERAQESFEAPSTEIEGRGPIVGPHRSDIAPMLAASRANCEVYLGDGERAITLLESCRTNHRSGSRHDAITAARLAQAHAQAGNPEQACAAALDALDTGEAVDSFTARNELRRSLAPLSRWPRRDDVGEVRHRVTALA